MSCRRCFQFVDLCDDIYIEVRADGEHPPHRRRAGRPAGGRSRACARRARSRRRRACPLGADIGVVQAHSRWAAGLGGGSSDAATCLVALNRLWGLGWSTDELAALGLTLGADVPVFVRGRAAWAEGVGERLTPLYPPLAPPECNYLIFKPNVVGQHRGRVSGS